MFVIVQDNFVIHGPSEWNKRKFEEILLEDCGIEHTLETRNNSNLLISVSNNVKIFPVVKMREPNYNPRLQMLHGPIWNFTDTVAEMSYVVNDYNIDSVKSFLTSRIMNIRYNKEVSGFKHKIQGTEVFIDTTRENRDIFVKTSLVMNDTDSINWKFNEKWIILTKSDLNDIALSIRNHIQSSFDWENEWINKINSSKTLQELNKLHDDLETDLETTGII